MDKNDKDIRKEIEELEKLIEQVKKQNEEEKKKQKKNLGPRRQIVMKINLGMEYSGNIFINLLISFLINFLIIFGLLNIFDFAYVSDITYVILISLILTFYEELYRQYLVRNFMSIVIFSSGLIFFLMNLLLFYFLDLAIFRNNFYFNSHWDPIIFVMFLHFVRIIVRSLYLQMIRKLVLKKLKRRR
jgi:hypothetical protein